MSSFASSPSQSPVLALDESYTRSVKSAVHTTRLQPIPPASSNQPFAPHTPILTSSLSSATTATSPTQQKVQPNSPSRRVSTNPISLHSSPCLTLSGPLKVSSEHPDSGMVDPISLSAKPRHSIISSFSFPGASSSTTTTHDRILEGPADSHCMLASLPSAESTTTSQQTPNVYINGLPAHCSEQDLFALARPFGNIKSVRTFTRHVSEKPTGYGFVLFSDIESARKCIEGLRNLRNLHPSFSKQIHRIPGTEYAQNSAAQPTDQDENSFKSRMDKLKDVASSNLYIEGLPLSVDEESLAALMKPHKIKSSRFFPTKLSNPPRIIAFVRLETRAAAEATIERLHGRMVRGWNDPGCRISVRFADSAEQRELRRAERSQKSGDQSPSRLTIARAALLNLRGQELQNIRNVVGPRPQRLTNALSDSQGHLSPGSDSGLLPISRSLPSTLCYPFGQSPLLSTTNPPINSEVNTLLQSVQHMGFEDEALDSTMRGSALRNEYFLPQPTLLSAIANATLPSPDPLPIALPRGHTQAQNGFTPAEELILEAHARRLQLHARLSHSSSLFEPISSLGKHNANVRGFDPVSHEYSPASALAGMATTDTLPTISGDELHAAGHLQRKFARGLQGVPDGSLPNVPATTSTMFMRQPSHAVSIVPPPPDYEEPGKRPKSQQRVERSRSSKQFSYSSSSFNNRQPIPLNESKSNHSEPLLQAPTHQNDRNSSNDGNSNTSNTTSCGENIEYQHAYMYSHGDARSCPEDKPLRFRSSSVYPKESPRVCKHHSTASDGVKSPTVVSPALTYSSRTPSTLSPATPFFGSFTGSQDAFGAITMESEDLAERKLKARVVNI